MNSVSVTTPEVSYPKNVLAPDGPLLGSRPEIIGHDQKGTAAKTLRKSLAPSGRTIVAIGVDQLLWQQRGLSSGSIAVSSDLQRAAQCLSFCRQIGGSSLRTIAIVNQKGGCGKTITAINLSAFLAREKRRVLLIDMDPQGHATLGLLKDPSQIQKTIADVLAKEPATTLRSVIIRARENLDLAPADILLAAVPEKLAATPGKENRLSEAVAEVRGDYDYLIVDCPPNVGLLTFNALKTCTEAIIPVEPSFFSLHGIAKQMETLEVLAKIAGHAIRARALITLYTGRSEFVKAVAEEIRRHLPDRSYNTVVRFSVKLSEAVSHGLPVAEFSTRSAGFMDYQSLAREVLNQESEVMVPIEKARADEADDIAPGGYVAVSDRPESLNEVYLEAAPPMPVGDGVMFSLNAPGAQCVQLAGDFNGWLAEGNEMHSVGGIWRKVVRLSPGRYHYRYVVDGGWLTDPLNLDVDPTPWGGYNSVFVFNGNSPRIEA